MLVCEKCGKRYWEWQAESKFTDEVCASLPVSYSQLHMEVCGDCAIEEYESGNYFEECECCGKRFYPETELAIFEGLVSHKVYDADMYSKDIYCAECAAKELLESLEEEYDEDDGESLSVYDAALIWASHGKDEDYMFGYTEDELEDAL